MRNIFFWLGAAAISLLTIIAAILIFARLLAAPASPSAQGIILPTAASGPSAQATPDAMLLAEQAGNSANMAASAANSIMSFIQSIGTVLGLLLVGGAVSTIAYVLRVVSKYDEDLTRLKKQSNDTMRALTLLQLGRQQMEFKNYRAAIRALEEADKFDQGNQAVNYFLGELYLQEYQQSDNLDRGIEHLKAATDNVEEYSRFGAAEAALAYALRLKGETYRAGSKEWSRYLDEAERLFRSALNDNPGLLSISGESWYGAFGNIYRQRGNLPRAIECYEQAAKTTPERSYPVNNLALLYAQTGNAAKTAEYFAKSLSIANRILDGDGFNTFAWLDRMTAELALGRPEEAQKSLGNVLELDLTPEILGKALIGLKRLKESPHPPAQIDEFIAQFEKEIATKSEPV